MEIMDFENIFKNLRMIMVVWLIAIFFSAIMFTIALMYDLSMVVIISIITGILSIIGIFFTGYSIIKISNSQNFLKYKLNKAVNN